MCTGTKIQQVRVFVSDDIVNIIAVDKETFARNSVLHFSPHMPSNPPLFFVLGLNILFSPQCWLSVQPALG